MPGWLKQGHPFNAALTENKAMVSTLKYGGIGFVALVLDLVPGANSAMSLVRPYFHSTPGSVQPHWVKAVFILPASSYTGHFMADLHVAACLLEIDRKSTLAFLRSFQ